MKYYVYFGQRDCDHKRSLIFASDNLTEIANGILEETDSFWCYTYDSLNEFIEEQDEDRIDTNIDGYQNLKKKAKKNAVEVSDIEKFSFIVADCEAYINGIYYDYQSLQKEISKEFPFSSFFDYEDADESTIQDLIESFNGTYGL